MDFLHSIIDSISSLIHHDGDNDNGDDNAPTVAHQSADGGDDGASPSNETGKEEVHDGRLYIDGHDMGPVKSGAMPDDEDVLNLLEIPANYEIPDDVLLPDDLAKVKFASEPNGFDRDAVADFYNGVEKTINYLISLLNKRNADVMKLADHIDKINEDLKGMEMQLRIQNSGLTVIADDSGSNENMNLSLKIKKLMAENRDLKARLSDTGSANLINETKKKYDEIQDELAMEQYSNKRLSDENNELKTKLGIMNDGSEIDFAQDIQTIAPQDQSAQHQQRTVPQPRQTQPQPSPSHESTVHRLSLHPSKKQQPQMLKPASEPPKQMRPMDTDGAMKQTDKNDDDDFDFGGENGEPFDDIGDQIINDNITFD